MIKKIYFSAALLSCASLAFGQIGANRTIGKSAEIAKSISETTQIGGSYSLSTPYGSSTIQSVINYKTNEDGRIIIAGSAGNGGFKLVSNSEGKISGHYICAAERKAYSYSTDASGNVIAKEVPIESLVCMDFAKVPSTAFDEAEAAKVPARTTAIPAFSSKPNSKYVIYIDLDGEYTQGPNWNNGNPINAQPLRTFTDADVEQLWNVTAQDYFPWDVNVTTDRAKFDAAPKKQRKMCVVTKTNQTGYPGVGGVAMIGSFDDGTDEVCWSFNDVGMKTTGETNSHEVGHTVGLNHDGQSPSTPDYYQGHNNWAPIMGAVYSTGSKKIDDENTVGQWSKGEYSGANRTENDLNIISTTNGFGYEPDDFGGAYTDANIGTIKLELDGKILSANNQGLITKTDDKDVFKLRIGAGDINIVAAPFWITPKISRYPNLNIKLRLLSSTGTELASADVGATPNTYASMSSTLTKTGLAAGTYYIEIDGVGNGSGASTGYTEYASLGGYNFSGTAPVPTGVDEEANINEFNIFPNPSTGAFNVTFNTAVRSNYKVTVVNTLGQKVYEETLNSFSGSYSKQLDLGQLGKGVYMINISDDENSSTKRAVAY